MGWIGSGRVFVSLKMREVEALVLSSPALDPGLNGFQQLLVNVLPRFVPDLRVGNGVKPQFISHDPAVVAAYRNDKLVHDRISARLARFIANAGPQTVAMAPLWTVPTLLMFAGDDRLLNARQSRFCAGCSEGAGDLRVLRGAVPRDIQRTGRHPRVCHAATVARQPVLDEHFRQALESLA